MKGMKGSLLLAGGLIAMCLMAGCETMRNPRQAQQAQEMQVRADRAAFKEHQQTVNRRLDVIQEQLDDVWRRQEELQRTQQSRSQQEAQQARTQIDALERRIQAIDQARERDRKQVVDELTATVTRLIREATPARTQQTRRTGGYGREHTVGAGQTLSEIASAYGVTMQAIIEANQLTNPDRLRVGDKLFIPD